MSTKLFLENEAKVDSNDSNGLYPVFNSQDIEQLKLFLDKSEKKINEILTKDNRNILYWVKDLTIAKYLVEEENVNPKQIKTLKFIIFPSLKLEAY